MRKRKYWYFITEWECPLCGRVETFRQRHYTRKPKAYCKRHEWFQRACESHFM